MLTLFIRKECHLCSAARQVLEPIAARMNEPLELRDIDQPSTDPFFRALYDHAVPVLQFADREIARHRVDAEVVESAIVWSRVAVCVLAKFPTPGKVKTRLAVPGSPFSPECAAEVHKTFLVHLLRRLAALHPAAVTLAFDPPSAEGAFRTLLSSELGEVAAGIRLIAQPPGDLGARLSAAQEAAAHPTLFLGTDAPDLPVTLLTDAAKKLLSTDTVLGPTEDGGYWTLGSQPSARLPLSKILHSIPWSSGHEYAATLERIAQNGYRCATTDVWFDVDHPPDLLQLLQRLGFSSAAEDQILLRALRTFLPGTRT